MAESGNLPFAGQRVQDMPAAGELLPGHLFYVEQGSSAGSQRKLTYGALRAQLLSGTAGGVTKESLGLQFVNNTADLDKPISNATRLALAGKAAADHVHDGSAIKTGNIDSARYRETLDAALDWLASGALPGDILFRGPQGWDRIPAGQSGQFLQSQGQEAPPVWTTVSVSSSTASAPTNVSPPSIGGSAVEGGTLVANDGVWNGNPAPTFARVWRRNGAPITGATGPTYVLTAADVGTAVSLLVTATNVVGSSVAASTGVSVTSALTPPVNTALPSITGVTSRGQVLTAVNGTWTGFPAPTFAYQWRRGGVAITGATAATYLTGAADVGTQISVAVTGTNSSGSATAVSAQTVAIADTNIAPANPVAPTISGTAIQGQVLTSNDGQWTGNPAPTITRQWKRGGVAISGATGPTYTLAIADVGSPITVTVTGTNSVGSFSATSAPTPVVAAPTAAPVNTALPTISGTQVQGSTLTSTTGTWTGTPAPTFTRQWNRNGIAISGAVGTTYLLTASDVGAQISMTVTATNSAGTQTATSAATGTITAPTQAPANTVLPAITGAASLGSVLTVSSGSWTGSPAPTYAYQWRRAGVNISGANAITYTVVQADVGSALSCLVTASNTAGSASALSPSTAVATADLTIAPQLVSPPVVSGGTVEGASAQLTQAVWSETAVVPTNTTPPAITGNAMQGQTLTATDGNWTGTGTLAFTRQWKRSGSPITGETGPTYLLTAADVGSTISITVNATSAYGSTNATSASTGVIAPPAVVPVNLTAPVISGTAQEGQTLTAANPGSGVIDPNNLTGTAIKVFEENWDNIDFYTGSNPSGRWATGYHWYPPEGGSLNGSMEQQWYVQKDYAPQASMAPPWTVSAGVLSITARQTPTQFASAVGNYPYYSGMLTTYRSFSQARGYWEARLKMPATKGFWPAFWLMPNDGSWPPEIDIMEFLSQDPTHYYATTHWDSTNQQAGQFQTTPDLSAAFHVFGVRIDDANVTYYFDGGQIAQHAMKPDMLGKSWYTILNLAVGGWNSNFPDGSTVFPANFQCDYVRAYVPQTNGSGTWSNNPTSFAFQWKRDGVNISGANAINYTLTSADVGKAIIVDVVASNTAGSSAAATSAPTAAVAAAVASAAGTTWNPAETSGTLSNSNRTVTNDVGGYGGEFARSVKNITGKRYFEVSIGNKGGGMNIGLDDPAQKPNPYDAAGRSEDDSVSWEAWGSVMNNWATLANVPFPETGGVARWAVDETARKFWVAANDDAWNGDVNANPATGVGGVTIPGSGLLYIHIKFDSGSLTDNMTLNTTSGQFIKTPPTGFTPIP